MGIATKLHSGNVASRGGSSVFYSPRNPFAASIYRVLRSAGLIRRGTAEGVPQKYRVVKHAQRDKAFGTASRSYRIAFDILIESTCETVPRLITYPRGELCHRQILSFQRISKNFFSLLTLKWTHDFPCGHLSRIVCWCWVEKDMKW